VLARQTLRLCRQSGAKLLVNADPAVANALDADGVHLPAKRFMHLRERPLGLDKLVAASCHDEAELAQAARIGCDFCVLSPVLPTASHPGAPTLGWERFRRLCLGASLPVYALGGMLRDHAAIARANWGQGVAMLGGIWTMADG
jgi:8-oxo-dGTP diphosphatase